ncbi:MAG: homocysteine S-methyltransferase family protein [Pseudohongiellaceae bacterium]
MSTYTSKLPGLNNALYLTDGGLESTLIFQEGVDLPCFAAFDLLKDEAGTEILRSYFKRYVEIARERKVGVILESPTWRANPDWAAKLGYDTDALADANRRAIGLLLEIRQACQGWSLPMIISGNLGPRGDGYRVGDAMTVAQARNYHAEQIKVFAETDADMVCALTMNYVEEAIGIVLAARDVGIPVVISFTLETDGRLPSGQMLADAIQQTDAATEDYAHYFMINCAHPTHFAETLEVAGGWRERIGGIRANASKRSHAELDNSTTLDDGDPEELGEQYRELRRLLPKANVLGGCCGTDHRHVESIFAACA